MNWKRSSYIYDNLKTALRNDYTARERDKLSASDTGCLLQRQLKLWKIKPDREPSDDELITFDYGNMLHSYLQDRLKGEDEIEVEDEHFIGHIDKVTEEDGELVVNEFKGIKDYGMDMLIKEGDQPKPEHIRQATNYVRMLKNKVANTTVDKLPFEVADKFRIVYIAKCFDDSHRKFLYERKNPKLAEGKVTIRIQEYTGKYDPKLAEEIIEEAKQIKASVKARKPLKCSEWDSKVYHRNSKWNNYISWCSKSVEENTKRLEEITSV